MQWRRAEQMLSGTASRIKNYPQLKAQLERHLDATRRQTDMVLRGIDRRGTSTSRVKDTAAKLVAVGQVDLHVRAHGNRVVQDPYRNGGGPRRYRNQAYMRADFAGRRKHGALARREPPLCDETVFGSRKNLWRHSKALKSPAGSGH